MSYQLGDDPYEVEHDEDCLCSLCAGDFEEQPDEMDCPMPDLDDSVKFCPNCERPNQFGELCTECQREEENEVAGLGLRGDN